MKKEEYLKTPCRLEDLAAFTKAAQHFSPEEKKEIIQQLAIGKTITTQNREMIFEKLLKLGALADENNGNQQELFDYFVGSSEFFGTPIYLTLLQFQLIVILELPEVAAKKDTFWHLLANHITSLA